MRVNVVSRNMQVWSNRKVGRCKSARWMIWLSDSCNTSTVFHWRIFSSDISKDNRTRLCPYRKNMYKPTRPRYNGGKAKHSVRNTDLRPSTEVLDLSGEQKCVWARAWERPVRIFKGRARSPLGIAPAPLPLLSSQHSSPPTSATASSSSVVVDSSYTLNNIK
ncbi:hypothetical protein BDY19DRAFT_916501 [Irpex rosettiformis]|uniref:Uncharacterized protein n=1 Tax=Irpex rosettiformis TaxID=378272 RepID=A0ACB8UNV4_9APHY|nr:hypothetical protein BDY19DRAFT_916501 [Irpex rosettiformis]